MLFGRFVKLFDPEQDIEIICNDEVVSRGKAKQKPEAIIYDIAAKKVVKGASHER